MSVATEQAWSEFWRREQIFNRSHRLEDAVSALVAYDRYAEICRAQYDHFLETETWDRQTWIWAVNSLADCHRGWRRYYQAAAGTTQESS